MMGVAQPRIGIVIGTTREGRFGEQPARWILELASARHDLEAEIVDLRDYPLPFLGEATAAGPNAASAELRWRAKLAELDGFVFVTAEYNHSVPGVLKNALDQAYAEFGRKPVAFVGYGGVGGARAVEQLRLICIELRMAPLGTAVHIGGEAFREAAAGTALLQLPHLGASAAAMLDDLAWWASVLRDGREVA